MMIMLSVMGDMACETEIEGISLAKILKDLFKGLIQRCKF
jgi:hypothetical protein